MTEVREGRLGMGVYAVRSILPGEVVLQGWGKRVARRSRHSIQVDHDHHLEVPPPIALINHSCEPNCGVLIIPEEKTLEIHALRTIEAGEELVTDYAMFESEIEFMTGPCLCDAPSCRGRIGGYWSLPEDRRLAYRAFIAPYLRDEEPADLADAVAPAEQRWS